MAFTIPHYEVQGFPREQQTLSKFTAVRAVRCLWSQRYSLAWELLDPTNLYPYNAFKAYCVHVDYRPWGEGDRIVAQSTHPTDVKLSHYLDWALVIAKYTTANIAYVNGLLIEERLVTGLEHRKGVWQRMQIGEGETARAAFDAEAPTRLEPVGWYMLRYPRYPTLPPAVTVIEGCINSGAYATKILGYTFPVRTMMYKGGKVERSLTTGGVSAWDVTHEAEIKRTRWDYIWDQFTATYVPYIDPVTGAIGCPFPLAAFTF